MRAVKLTNIALTLIAISTSVTACKTVGGGAPTTSNGTVSDTSAHGQSAVVAEVGNAGTTPSPSAVTRPRDGQQFHGNPGPTDTTNLTGEPGQRAPGLKHEALPKPYALQTDAERTQSDRSIGEAVDKAVSAEQQRYMARLRKQNDDNDLYVKCSNEQSDNDALAQKGRPTVPLSQGCAAVLPDRKLEDARKQAEQERLLAKCLKQKNANDLLAKQGRPLTPLPQDCEAVSMSNFQR